MEMHIFMMTHLMTVIFFQLPGLYLIILLQTMAMAVSEEMQNLMILLEIMAMLVVQYTVIHPIVSF